MKYSSFAKKIYSHKMLQRITYKCTLLPWNTEKEIEQYFQIHILGTGFLFIISWWFGKWGLCLFFLSFYLFHIGHERLALDEKIKKRKRLVMKEAILFLEMLSLSLENKTDFLQAFTITCETVENSFAKEMKGALKEMNTGYTFKEVMLRVSKKLPKDAIADVLRFLGQDSLENDSFKEKLDLQLKELQTAYQQEMNQTIQRTYWKIGWIAFGFFIGILLLFLACSFL